MFLRLGENFSSPGGEVCLVVPDLFVFVEVEALEVIDVLALLALRIPPRALMLHAGPVGHPMVDVLPHAGELLPALGIELHDAAVLVHEE